MLPPDTPEGTPVELTEDNGTKTITKTRSICWQVGSGQWIVKVEGKTGGYSCLRIRTLPK